MGTPSSQKVWGDMKKRTSGDGGGLIVTRQYSRRGGQNIQRQAGDECESKSHRKRENEKENTLRIERDALFD